MMGGMRPNRVWLLAWLLALVLAACAPSATTPKAAVARVEGPISFYPRETGLHWQYLRPGDPFDAPAYHLEAAGPAAFLGHSATQFRFFGRGQERVYYREVSDQDGQKLYGFEEKITLSQVSFDPPFLEYPPASLLAVGYRWGGKTRVKSVFTLPEGRIKQAELTLDYGFEVVARRTVEVPAGRFDAFVIRYTAKGGDEGLAAEIWFVPHVGEVRTREGLVLVKKNF